MTLILKPKAFANGGAAFARDDQGRPVFVRHAIPGETVRARLTEDGKRYAWAEPEAILVASPERVVPRCPHFGPCGGCHFQHMSYELQLQAKRQVVQDQMSRVGGFEDVTVRPVIAHPQPWRYSREISLSPAGSDQLGLWSPSSQQVMPIAACHLIDEDLEAVMNAVDLNLPGLRSLTLRMGEDGQAFAVLEVEEGEPPILEVDFPISVAIILPEGRAASLIGDAYLTRVVKNRPFRVSPGCFFQASEIAAELLVDVVVQMATFSGQGLLLEAYSGVGMLTAFLAQIAHEVIAVEVNDDAATDMAANLADKDNVTLYQGLVEEALPALDVSPQVVVADPGPRGMAKTVLRQLADLAPQRLVYVSSEISTLSRDGRYLTEAGYRLAEIQPIDLRPQTYFIDTVSLWTRP